MSSSSEGTTSGNFINFLIGNSSLKYLKLAPLKVQLNSNDPQSTNSDDK